MGDHVDHAMFQQIFGALESFGQFLTNCLLNHPLSGKADERARLCNLDIAQHCVRRGDTAGGGVRKHNDVGQSGIVQHLNGNG